MAQSVKVAAFSSGHDLRVLGPSLVSGSLLSRNSASSSAPPPPRVFSLLLSLPLSLHLTVQGES